MIVTVTPNPSVDRTVFLDDVVLGSINRSRRSRSEPSGKGVNVALALHALDVPTRALVTAGGSVGAQLQQMLADAGLHTLVVPIAGEIRSNISLTQPNGRVTKINEAGPALSLDETDRLLAAVTEQVRDACWLVCGGSLPTGMPVGWYRDVVEVAHTNGVPVAVDTSGDALAQSLIAAPDLVKPNVQELAELTGRLPHTLGDVIDAAQEVRRRGARTVLASLGGDGAVLVDATGAIWGHAPVEKVVSTVGAGDAMLAGYLSCPHGRGEALATALRWGAAAVQNEGTLFSPNVSTAQATTTAAIDLERRLG
ncbi:1-phosphofructokinase [Mycobacterium sp. ITM-2016-00318]|uniref:1-phosphofructokinase n=1 Tax=Mycobacterium sp. ITM-2016-00318 TaxID=2099693 RepID=UPI001304F68C|nr:1-phosphofructokinase [Mycobacterium sp. ITM-2016-00318]WNG92077.1 1-phosphofructokinase [Mycobacterium sp. ITM-2016-00318]